MMRSAEVEDGDDATKPNAAFNVADTVTVQHSVEFCPTPDTAHCKESAKLNVVLHEQPHTIFVLLVTLGWCISGLG